MEAIKVTEAAKVKTAQAAPGKRVNVTYLTELALLTAIVILMAYTPLGYLKIGAESITFIVVPVAVGAVLLGPKAGAFLGGVFGLTSLAQCFGMDAFGTMLFSVKPFATAVCCIVPRILVGLVPALVFAGMSRVCKKRAFNIAVSCVAAPVTNTLLYLTFMALLFQPYLTEAYGYTGKGGPVFLGWLLALVAVNAVLEAAACLIIGSAVCNVLWLVTKNRRQA